MRMMSPDEVPGTKIIGILSGCAILLFALSAWLIVWAGEGYDMYGFPPFLIGIVLLFMALALFALRLINQRSTQPPAPPSS